MTIPLSDNSILARMRTAVARTLAEHAARTTMPARDPAPGVCFVVPLPEPIALRWVVTHQHPDDPDLFHIVPADEETFVGNCDVPVVTAELGALTLRCGEGFWISGRHLPANCCVGALSEADLALARGLLAALARGELIDDPTHVATDWDPEYEDWLEAVASCRERWREELERETVSLATVPSPAGHSVEVAEFVLAADPGAELLRDLDDAFARVLDPGSRLLPAVAIAPESVWMTNPVWCLERLGERLADTERAQILERVRTILTRYGVSLPGPVPEPGVVGLAVDARRQVGLVVPLRVRRAPVWEVAATLPFRAEEIQELLLSLLVTLDLPRFEAIPERFAFAVDSPLDLHTDGSSMHLAGLLAILDCLTDADVLRQACVLVEPTTGGALRAVNSTACKLDAFLREYRSGTLLVVEAEAEPAPEIMRRFERVWRVASLADLARFADCEGLLRPLLEDRPLQRDEFDRVRDRIDKLRRGARYTAALDLVRRARRECALPAEVPLKDRRRLLATEAELCRHLGRYDRAEELARELALELRGEAAWTSYDERAEADVEHAAAFYDRHDFAAMVSLLEPWLRERIDPDPQVLQPETRIKIFNTLGRACAILGAGDWEALFRRSLAILTSRDPYDLGRTYGYLIGALLRHGRTEAARTALDEATRCAMPGMSRWFLLTAEAEWSRQVGRQWTEPEMEIGPPTVNVNYIFALYFQATARQPGRTAADRTSRLRRAAHLVRTSVPPEGVSILTFLADCLDLAVAASEHSAENWTAARTRLGQYLEALPGNPLADYYRDVWAAVAVSVEPKEAVAEALLRRIPYT